MNVFLRQKICFLLGSSLITAFLLHLFMVEASSQMIKGRPIVIVNEHTTIEGSEIRLGDISKISVGDSQYEDLGNVLKDAVLGEAPPPKTKITLPGEKILEIIKESGISHDSFGYSIPRAVVIERAGRVLKSDELIGAVRKLLTEDELLDLQVREVRWSNAQVIPLGDTRYGVQRLGRPNAGKLPLRIAVYVDKKPVARFVATAVVDDWRAVPVVSRTLDRGMLITPDDIQVVRLNLYKQPIDVASSVDDVLGRRVKSRIKAGETLRKSLIDIPPVIPQGKLVKMVYRRPGIQAIAEAITLEDGYEGGTIRVKNSRSRRVLRALVIDPNTVEVEAR